MKTEKLRSAENMTTKSEYLLKCEDPRINSGLDPHLGAFIAWQQPCDYTKISNQTVPDMKLLTGAEVWYPSKGASCTQKRNDS